MDFKQKKQSVEALERAAKECGGVTALVDAIGIARRTYYYWRDGTDIPAIMAVTIEDVTDGAVSKSDLRPDIF